VVGYFMPGIGLPQLDWNRINGMIYTPKASPDVQFLSGGVFHYVDGNCLRRRVRRRGVPALEVAPDRIR